MSVIARILVALIFTVLVGYFALNPTLVRHAPETALIKMSFTHGGERVVECRRLSREEMLALPPNMRKREDCPRERHPVRSL